MATTSLKLPDDIKQRAASAAAELGVTPHAFMVEAIRKAAEAAEKHAEFVAQARAARKKMLKTGLGHDADAVHAHLRQRVNAAQAAGSEPSVESLVSKATPWRG